MALPTYNELKGLDWGYQGGPFLNTPAKSIDLTTLDYAEKGSPFNGNNYGAGTVTVNRDCQFPYNLYNLVNKDCEFDYRIYSAVIDKDCQFIYKIYNAVDKDCQFKYNIGSPVNKDCAFKYRILYAVNKDNQFVYNIGVLCHNDCQFPYKIYGLVNKDCQFKYNLGYIVGNSEEFKYRILYAINKDFQFKYNLGYIVGQSEELKYRILPTVHADNQYVYNLGYIVGRDLEIVYRFSSVFSDLAVIYNIGQVINKDCQFKFNVQNLVNKDFQFRYYIGQLIDKDCQFVYNSSFIQVDSQIPWDVLLRTGQITHLQSNLNNQVGRWRFNESGYSGITGEVKDSSGYGNDGTASGIISTVPGLFGNAVQFTGANQIQIPNNYRLNLSSAFSILMWLKPEQYNGIIFWKGGSVGINDYSNYKVGIDASGHIYFGSNEMGWLYSTSILSLYKWYFVACEYHGGTQLRIFLNCILDNAQAALGVPNINTYPLWIGTSFVGRVDEACLLNQSIIMPQMYDTYFKQPTLANTISVPS